MPEINNNSAKPALLFVPDISGFTKFVKDTEIAHSSHIIQELLEKLIESDEIGLQVSEVEGDAILFYRFGNPPSSEELFLQIKKMFINFHNHLKLYETQRICRCGACCSAQDLTLKIVTHYGNVSESQVKDHKKLFGQDVITVHRLLKNDISDHEYTLLTESLINEWNEFNKPDWTEIQKGSSEYDVGMINYNYFSLAPLRELVPEPHVVDYTIDGMTKQVFSYEQDVCAPMDLIFTAATDLPLRLYWMQGAKVIDKMNHQINRVGSKHRCLVDKSSPVMVTSGVDRNSDIITLIETDEKKIMCTVCTLTKESEINTHLKMNGFVKDVLPVKILFSLLLKKKVNSLFKTSTENLKNLCERIYQEQQAVS